MYIHYKLINQFQKHFLVFFPRFKKILENILNCFKKITQSYTNCHRNNGSLQYY